MKSLITLMTALLSFAAFSAYAADCSHTISVTGKAEEKAKPDVAYVTVYAQTDGILMVDAVRNADRLVQEITSAVRPETKIVRNVEVVDVALGEKTTEYWRSDQKPEPPRPQVVRRIRLTCAPKPDAIYDVVDKAIRSGAVMQMPSTVRYSEDIRSVVVYGLERSADVVERLRAKALDAARADAEKSARLAGRKVGEVVSMGCSGFGRWGMPVRVMGMQADFPTEYIGTSPEQIVVSHSVEVSFDLQ